ncbi:MAG: hypothetical protein WBE17_14535, partial [Anaerolineae bacterium]
MDCRPRVVPAALLVGLIIMSVAAPGAASAPFGAPLAPVSARADALPPAQQTTVALYLPVIGQRSQPYPAPIGQIGGQALAVAVLGDYAYVGVGPRLLIVDIHDPAAPQVVGQSWFLTFQEVRDIAVVHEPASHSDAAASSAPGETLAYVAARSRGLHIFNVSDPAHPVLRGSYYNQLDALGVAVVGSLAYVAAGWSGLQIFDVSDSTSP